MCGNGSHLVVADWGRRGGGRPGDASSRITRKMCWSCRKSMSTVLPLNKDQQLGPVPKSTPWPGIPPALDGKVIDDWMKARMLVTKEAKVTVVVLEPAKHRELTRPAWLR